MELQQSGPRAGHRRRTAQRTGPGTAASAQSAARRLAGARFKGLVRELIGAVRPGPPAPATPTPTPTPHGIYPVLAALLVPGRHRLWHDGRLWDLADLDSGTLTAITMRLVDGDGHRALTIPYDQEVPALNTRPDADTVDSLTRGRRT